MKLKDIGHAAALEEDLYHAINALMEIHGATDQDIHRMVRDILRELRRRH
jgi:hypothetical protein